MEDRAVSLNAVIATIYDSSGNFKNDFDQGFFADKIRALPPVTPCEDAISRQEVLDEINRIMVLPSSCLVGIRKGQTMEELNREIREAYEIAGETI